MVICLNETDTIGYLVIGLVDITGSLFLSLLLILIILLMVALALRIPIEFISVLLLPLLIVLMACSGEFLAVFGVMLIYLGFLLAKYLFFR